MVAWLEAELARQTPAGRVLVATIAKVHRSTKPSKDYGANAKNLAGDSRCPTNVLLMLGTESGAKQDEARSAR